MLALLIAAAVTAGLGPRPAALTGADAAAYGRWLHARTLTADRAFGAPACPAAATASVSHRTLAAEEIAEPLRIRRASAGPVLLERVRLSGCGREAIHTLQVYRLRRGGPWEAIALLPGELRSTPRAQNEAMQTLGSVILNRSPPLPCPSAEALRSLVHGQGRVLPGGAARAWTERWPVTACGMDRSVDAAFTGAGPARITPAWDRP